MRSRYEQLLDLVNERGEVELYGQKVHVVHSELNYLEQSDRIRLKVCFFGGDELVLYADLPKYSLR